MPGQEDIKKLADLNVVAVNELKLALAADTQLLPAWRDAALQLLEEGIPENLQPFLKLIEGDNNA